MLGPMLIAGLVSAPVSAQWGSVARPGAPVRAPADSLPPAAEVFVRRATEATRRFESRTEAIRAGYRRLGPDFPGMGEHWVHPALVVRGAVESDSPPVLSYVDVGGEPVLVGLAFTLPLGPDDDPPAAPFGLEVWHDHSGGVDEETLLLNHPASAHGGEEGYRLSMVHVWTDLENPAGILAQNNWRLPFLRVGLIPPEEPAMDDARGVSLAHGGRNFYGQLLRRAADLSAEEELQIDDVLGEAASHAEAAIQAALDTGGQVWDPAVFGRIWRDFWDGVRTGVREETWQSLARLAGSGDGHH